MDSHPASRSAIPGSPAAPPPEEAGAGRRELTAWATYEFASNAFNTLVVTFIFSRYFQSVVVGDDVEGLRIWTRAVNLSAVTVALAMPVLGAAADFSGRKMRFLAWSTAGTVLLTMSLFFVGPGMVLEGFLIFVAANILFEAAAVFYNGFLPELTGPRRMGRISGIGWAAGYAGGIVCLLLALAMMQRLPTEGSLDVRSTMLLAAAWYAIFALPMFFMVKERQRRRRVRPRVLLAAGVRRVRNTFAELRVYRQVARLLVARLVYNDGLVVIFSFASIYLGSVYDLGLSEIIVLAIALNVAAGIGAVAFGFVNDRIGARATIAVTLVVLTVATLAGAWAPTVAIFWVPAMVVGLMVGPNQSASRAMLATFTPRAKQGEFFGFFAFSGKLASVAGPLVFQAVQEATGSFRIAMASVAGFFVAGLILLLRVDEEEGIATAAKLSKEG
jgi:MFS transporter, UMF1 family